MEQEKHLTDSQEKPKVCTRATARHLRRKRLKDARRAEKLTEHVKNVNDALNRGIDELANTYRIDEKLLSSIELESSSNLTQYSLLRLAETENKAQDHCSKSNNIEIDEARSEIGVNIGWEEHSARLFHSHLNKLKFKPEIPVSQTEDDKSGNCTASINVKSDKNSTTFRTELYSTTDFPKANCVNCVDATASNPVKDFARNGDNFKVNDLSNIVDSGSSAVNNIEIKSDEAESCFVNNTLSGDINNGIIAERHNIRNVSVGNFSNEKINVSPQISTEFIEMTDDKSSVPEKTREEVKAEREAKKAARAAAKAKAKTKSNKVTETVEDIKKKDEPSPFDTEIPQDAVKTNVVHVTDAQGPRSASEVKSEESTAVQPLNVSTHNDARPETNEGKSKAELRAERRARQETQRTAKASNQQQQQQSQLPEKKKQSSVKDSSSAPRSRQVSENAISGCASAKRTARVRREDSHEIKLFKHLYDERELSSFDITVNSNIIHPAIVRLGMKYASKTIVGSNARCVALLADVRRMIEDFEKPAHADFVRGLEASMQKAMAYLHHCRPIAVSMQNAMRHLKWQMAQFSPTMSDSEAKNQLTSLIDTYIEEQIQLAGKAISLTIQTKISNGDVILTYGHSALIYKILVDAQAAGKQFRVIIVDGRPWLEGRELLRRLVKHGIECSYILINALSFIMPEVSKVFLGAHAILANGAVMSRVGTAQVALMARAFNVPVLVACETHKSSERVQTDSIVYNELGIADDLVANWQSNSSGKPILNNWRMKKSLNLLNITYDVTPADLVTAVVTELAILPCTSVPVILRIKPNEI